MAAGAMMGAGAALQLAPYAAWGINKVLGTYGKKPVVPELTPINPDATQKATIAGNQANFADAAKLAASVNTFNQDQLNALIDKALGVGARQQIEANISSQLRGEIPQDVQNQIFRGVAQRTAAGNAFGGGGFTRNITARDLGLTSLDITNRALSSAESWLAQAKAPQMDVTSMFFSPQQRLAFEQQQQGVKFQRDLLAAGVKAAPDPDMAAFGDVNMQAAQGLASMGQGMMGMGMMGGGGGGSSSMVQPSASYSSNFGGGLGYNGGFNFMKPGG